MSTIVGKLFTVSEYPHVRLTCEPDVKMLVILGTLPGLGYSDKAYFRNKIESTSK